MPDGGAIRIPRGCTNLHHEVELGVVVGARLSRATQSQCLDAIGAVTSRLLSIIMIGCSGLRARARHDGARVAGGGEEGRQPLVPRQVVRHLVPRQRLPAQSRPQGALLSIFFKYVEILK